jgi:hypothetical protein
MECGCRGRDKRKENAGLLHVILDQSLLNRRLCHEGHSIKFTTLLSKDCKTRGNSREIFE